MSYFNADGAYVLTGTDQGAIRPNGVSEDAILRTMVIDIDFTQIPAAVTAANINPMDATLPANSVIQSAYLFMSTAAASGGAATLDIGTYNAAGTAVAATGIVAAAALSTVNTAGAVLRAAGALTTTASTGAAPVYVVPKYGTAAYTAGAGKLYINYVVTGV